MIDVVEYALLRNWLKNNGGGSGSGTGADGASAYEIAVKNGFTGTEQEWLESLKGESATISIDKNGHIIINGEDTEVNIDTDSITSEQIQGLFTIS